MQPPAWIDLNRSACSLPAFRVSLWSIAGLIAERAGGGEEGGGRASGRGGFQKKVGVKMVLTGRESWRDLKGEQRGAGVGAVRAGEGASTPPPLHPPPYPTPGHLAVCRAAGRQIRIWEGEITSLLPPGRGCWSQGRRRAGQAGRGGRLNGSGGCLCLF